MFVEMARSKKKKPLVMHVRFAEGLLVMVALVTHTACAVDVTIVTLKA